jgi:hypothetical protein
MINGFEGIPTSVAAQRLGVTRSTVQLLVKEGILVKIPISGKCGRHQRYHIDEDSLKNYQKKYRRAGR